MKNLLKIVAGIVTCLALVLVALSITGFGPRNRTPGLWIKGNLVTTPVADWSFTDKYPTVEVQTRTWYRIPHSVTIGCVAYGGQLYLTSVYPPGVKYPYGRNWNENVARDPHVRIKIGDQLYDRVLVRITDQALKTAVLKAKAAKYPNQRVVPSTQVQLFHVVE